MNDKLHFIRPLKALHQAGFQTAIAAGGAIRDYYHNKPYRDVDLFVWNPNYCTEVTPFKSEMVRAAHVHVPDQALDVWSQIFGTGDINTKFDDYDEDDDVMGVWDLWTNNMGGRYRGHGSLLNIQIIMTKKMPIEHVEDCFDIGLCKCYCDGRKLHYSADFMTDATNKTLTIVGKNMTHKRYQYTIDRHIPRMKDRYPYPVLYAPHNAHLIPDHVIQGGIVRRR